MRFWLIAIWRTVPRKWWIVLSPIAFLIIAFVLWFLFAGLLFDGSEQRGAVSLDQLLVKAKRGDVRAQFEAAQILSANRQIAAAVKWLERSAQNGYVDSQIALARRYADGDGVRQDFDRAIAWYGKAAVLKKHSGAQFELGNFYFQGRGVETDFSAAVSWYRKAGFGGHRGAQTKLGTMYEKGFGVDKDVAEAYAWLSLAGNSESLKNLTRRMTRLQIKRGKSKLRTYSKSNPVSR